MRRAIKTFFKAVVIAVIVLIVFFFIGGANLIKGRSMAPNYLDGQECISLKIIYWFSQPKRGDVVIYTSLKNPNMDYIGRIIALPGERITIKDSKVYINDQILSESYMSPNTDTLPGSFNDFIVDSNSYFIMGDNRSHSDDSRQNGAVNYKNIKSKVILKIGK